MNGFVLAASILLNPSGAIDYVPGTILQWVTPPGTYVSALAFVDPRPGYAPTIFAPFTAPTLTTLADHDVWTFELDAVIGHGCRAQPDLYRQGATFFNPSIAVVINYGDTCGETPVCLACDVPVCLDCDVSRCEDCDHSTVPEPTTVLQITIGLLAAYLIRFLR